MRCGMSERGFRVHGSVRRAELPLESIPAKVSNGEADPHVLTQITVTCDRRSSDFRRCLSQRLEAWASIILTLNMLLLAAAGMAIYLVPSRRPFLICAVIMGVIYGSIALVRPLGLSHSLVTSRVLFGIWYPEQQGNIGGTTGVPTKDMAYGYWLLTEAPNPDSFLTADVITSFRSFQQIGHCAVAVILATFAGLIGSYVARRSDLNARANHGES